MKLRRSPRTFSARLRPSLLAFIGLLAIAAPADAGDQLAGPVPAEVIGVVDGDTLRVRAEIWLDLSIEVLVRIRGIDTPEIRGACELEKELAANATATLDLAVRERRVVLADIERDKYFGRVVATVATADGVDLALFMRESGLARAYDGGARLPWCGDLAAGF